MKVVALDIGDRRIGVARSDPLNITAQGLTVIPVKPKIEKTYAEIADLLEQEEAQLLVVGLPRNMNASEGPAAQKVREFVRGLSEYTDIPVEYVDERLTTVSARRALLEGDVSRRKRKQVVDKMAATIILQAWLDRRK